MLIRDKVCVIVGTASAKGIGDATVRLFADHGAQIIASDIVMDEAIVARLRAAASDPVAARDAIQGHACDITDLEQCRALMAYALTTFGRIDCLVNCAGIVEGARFDEIDEAMFDRITTVNLKGTFNLCKAAVEVFVRQSSGNIINLSSAAAQRGAGLAGGAHYAASKGGVISLTRSIAREYGPQNIRANVICPAMIDTQMLDGFSAERQQEIVETIPLRRVGHPVELAGTCLFLASDLSGFITGATIDVNGGAHIH